MSKSKAEALIQCAIAAHLGEKNIMIPNVSFARTSCRVPRYGNNGQLIGHEYPFKGVRRKISKSRSNYYWDGWTCSKCDKEC